MSWNLSNLKVALILFNVYSAYPKFIICQANFLLKVNNIITNNNIFLK